MLKLYKIPLLTVFLILFIDQFVKIYIKLNYPLGEVGRLADWCVIHFTENPGMVLSFMMVGNGLRDAMDTRMTDDKPIGNV